MAVYSGSSVYLPSTSQPVSLTVTPLPTTISLQVSPNPSPLGQPVSLSEPSLPYLQKAQSLFLMEILLSAQFLSTKEWHR